MNADFLAMLGGGGSGPSSASTRRDEGKSIVNFKAGKMIAERKENGKYLISPDPRRGIIDMKWTANGSSGSSGAAGSGGLLKLEWMDRRTNATVDSLTIFPEDECTYSKVDTGSEGDRVYLLQYGNNSERRFFFWMQEKEEGNEDEDNCVKINMYMADPAEAAAAANGTSTEGNDAASADDVSSSNTPSSQTEQATLDELASLTMNGLNSNPTGSTNNTATTSTSGNEEEVDLSRLLSTTANTTSTNASSNEESKQDNPTNAGGLTLLDLQGAMASLATTSPPAAAAAQIPGPPLDELVSPSSVIEAGILNDEAVKARLIELLPEGQRSEEKLMENIRSPQVAQCLKSLTAALCDDEGGSMDNFNSILANFQLSPEDGALSMAVGNPIQAFLDCILKSLQKEKESQHTEEEKEDTEMSED